jgi:hypothetical protein
MLHPKFQDDLDLEAKKELESLKLHRAIAEKIGWEGGKDVDKVIGKYKVVKEHRIHKSCGWTDRLEIELADQSAPMWPLLRGGTATINVPPDDVIKEFFEELDKFLAD